MGIPKHSIDISPSKDERLIIVMPMGGNKLGLCLGQTPKLLVKAACMLHLWWRTETKLAIVFTDFFFICALLFNHFGDTQEVEFL